MLTALNAATTLFMVFVLFLDFRGMMLGILDRDHDIGFDVAMNLLLVAWYFVYMVICSLWL